MSQYDDLPAFAAWRFVDIVDYTSEDGFEAVLEYDRSGLIVNYPGIAERFA